MQRDPRCVFVADNFALGEVLAAWLGEQGIPAQVMNPATLGGLVGLSVWALAGAGVSAQGLEVWVLDPADADRARLLLEEHQQTLRERAAGGGPVRVVCEECGKAAEFPAGQRGSVQNCPHCEAYLDVPDEGDEGADDGA